MCIRDRSNAAVNSIVNAEQMMQLLNTYSDSVKRCEEYKKGSKKKIICSRKKGIILSYIKDKKYAEAKNATGEMLKKYPVFFCWTMFKYVLKRIAGKNY